MSDHYFLVIRMGQNGIFCTYAVILGHLGRDGSALQVAIFDIFISYFGFGEIYWWSRTLFNLKDVGSLFLGDPDGSTWHLWLL